jgi:hypothetical protein
MEPSAAHRPGRFGCRPAGRCRSPAWAGAAVGNGADSPGTRPEAALGARMSYHNAQPPDLVPILSPGKHPSPRTGACFMELASLLAGERWSDHPACTHRRGRGAQPLAFTPLDRHPQAFLAPQPLDGLTVDHPALP